MTSKRIVIFDFDGTLANSLISGLDGFNYAYEKMGMPKPESSEIKKYFGAGASSMAANSMAYKIWQAKNDAVVKARRKV